MIVLGIVIGFGLGYLIFGDRYATHLSSKDPNAYLRAPYDPEGS